MQNTTTKKLIQIKGITAGPETVYNGQTGVFVEGWASVCKPEDRKGDVIANPSSVFQHSLITYFELNPILLYEHGLHPEIGNIPLGNITAYQFSDYGLKVKAFVRRPLSGWQPLLQVYLDIQAGYLKAFSIGGLWEYRGNEIVAADLCEISIVATPAQPYAVFDLATKSFNSLATGKTTLVRDVKTSPASKLDKTAIKNLKLAIALKSQDYWMTEAKRLLSVSGKGVAQKHKGNVAKRLDYITNYIQALVTIS